MHQRAVEFRRAARDRHGFDPEVHEFPEGTKTAADAAAAISCDVAQIASSIAVDTDDGLAVVVTSGANRVDLEKVADLLDVQQVEMADAGDIKAVLGWSIGGVPPFCHETSVPVLLDETLLSFDEVWAAAGTPEAVFPLSPDQLRELSGGTAADVKED
ncbi:YbaK/EbsC family protein [Halorarius litoreus]|uniref:YbaK/EbsC family protein n=1 Tax=Halorarius litoreus TaxID=2962676 RepID=UPI0020CECB45|nr:YbaK/EbsC family protein [Halorarius litoreus]